MIWYFIPEKVEAYRNFANKIWNAARFTLMNLEHFEPGDQGLPENLSVADQWILSRFEYTASEVTRLLERYDIGEGAKVLYDFIWSELCDWYIEWIKPRLYGRQGEEENATQLNMCYGLFSDIQWNYSIHTCHLLRKKSGKSCLEQETRLCMLHGQQEQGLRNLDAENHGVAHECDY